MDEKKANCRAKKYRKKISQGTTVPKFAFKHVFLNTPLVTSLIL